MKYIDILKDSFVEAISNSEIKFSDKNRKLSELDIKNVLIYKNQINTKNILQVLPVFYKKLRIFK